MCTKMVYKLACIILASSLPFMFTLHGDFVFDDSEAIIKNKDVVSEAWTDAFHHDFWGTDIKSNSSHKSYRPLTILTFRLNYALNNKQLSAWQFKATNLLCHIVCCLLVWRSFQVIVGDFGTKGTQSASIDVAFTAALLFAVHPIHVEAVSGSVGRADLLAATTFFLVFLIYNESRRISKFSDLFIIFCVVLAGVSMLFKENGVTVLGFCVTYDCIELITNSNTKKQLHLKANSMKRVIKVLFGVTALLSSRWIIMGGNKPEFKAIDNPAAFSDSLFTKAASFSYIYFLNGLLLIWPQWLCYDWSMGCVSLIETLQDLRLLLVMALYLYGILVLRAVASKFNYSSRRLILTALSLTMIPFLPAANIFYAVGFVIAERVLYIPSAGYCLFVAVGLKKLCYSARSRKISTLLFSFLILTYGLRSWQRSRDWQTEYELFVRGMDVCPNNAKVRYNVAKVADAKRNPVWAIQEYKEAIRLNPEYYQAMNNLANLLKNRKQYKQAEMYLRDAIKLKRDFPAAWMNLGIVLSSLKRHDEALDAYKTALEYRTNYPDCLYNLGILYLELNKTKEAMDSWFLTISLNSTHVLAWTNLLALLDNTGQLDKATEVIPRALTELPDAPTVNFAIANIYGKLDRFHEAETHFQKAIKLFDKKVQALHYSNLGVLYHRWKKHDLAEQMYRNALDIDPHFKSAQRNLKSIQKFKN